MAKREQLRAGEVPVLFGEDKSKTEWSLWNDLVNGTDNSIGEYGRWQGRLAVPIMTGIAEDHGLKVQGPCSAEHVMTGVSIIPPRAWRIAPSMLTGGRSSILVVVQKSAASLREWSAPNGVPQKQKRRHQAIAAAYGVNDVLIGVLVDGYSSALYHVHAHDDEIAEIITRVDAMIESVRANEEPDIDFNSDEGSIRAGIAVTKVDISAENVEALVGEREQMLAKQSPADAALKAIQLRIRQIETHLIHLAGTSGKIDSKDCIVTIDRNAKGTPTVTVARKQAVPLF